MLQIANNIQHIKRKQSWLKLWIFDQLFNQFIALNQTNARID